MQKQLKFQTASFFIILAITVVLVARIFLPYASVLLWSVIFYIMIGPFYHKLIKRLNQKSRWFGLYRRVIAGAFSVGAIVVIAATMFFFVIKLIAQGRTFASEIVGFFQTHPHVLQIEKNTPLNDLVLQVSLGTIDLSTFDIKKELMNFCLNYANTLVRYATGLAGNIGNFILSLLFMCFALYFLFIDGAYLGSILVTAIPIQLSEGQRLAAKVKDTLANLFTGYFLVSVCQFAVAFAVYALFQVKGAVLLSFLTFFSSFLPFLGCALVWFPIGVEMMIGGAVFKGVIFLCVAGLLISSMDNLLRPMFLENRIQIHPLLIFFSILGGIRLFKLNGIVLGPLFLILLFTLIDIARTADNTDSESSGS